MEKILIKENKKQAEIHIKIMNETAARMTNLLKYYNDLPVLQNLKTVKEIKDFFSNPVKYFENAIITDTGATFSEKAKPMPEQVAKIFNIPYIPVIDKIYQTQISNIDLMEIDSKNLTVSPKPDAIQTIYEQFKEYTKTENEAKLFLYTRELCDHINKYIELFDIDSIEINQAARALRLDAIVKPTGRGYQIAENPDYLKEKAKKIIL
ncbi:MAG: hypothetical protein AB7S50_08190 [Bacteroidales bacterium]